MTQFGNRLADKYAEKLPGSHLYKFKKEVMFYDITPAAVWWLQDTKRDSIDWRADLPSICSPSPLAWYEFVHPRKQFIGGKWIDDHPEFSVAGLVIRLELNEQYQQITGARWSQQIFIIAPLYPSQCEIWGSITDLLDIEGKPLLREDDTDRTVTKGYPIEAIPLAIESKERIIQVSPILSTRFPSYEQYKLGTLLGEMAVTLAIGISLLHCKNIDSIDESPSNSTQVNRARCAQNKPPAIKFKVLSVNNMKAASTKLNHNKTTTLKQALHIMRGHFKTYTEEAPLFGKYTGTYWWEQCLRGNTEKGIIHKTYKVQI